MFNAIYINKTDAGQMCALTELEPSHLPEGDVLIEVAYSTLNYKDALAITGKAPVLRQFPMIPGIDLAGKVLESRSARFKPGDQVIVNGFGVGEMHWGGLAQVARLQSEWLLALPDAFTARESMIIGTAGYTAALCVNALLECGIHAEKGEILVTGASGGVGSIAVALLASMGYTVVASTGKPDEKAYLQSLGADAVINRALLSEKGKPLQKERWAGVIDSVGSHTLANACAQIRYGGAVAACGLAQGADFPATVMPFILRGVTLCGVDSVMASQKKRKSAWDCLAQHLTPAVLESICSEVSLSKSIEAANDVVNGKVTGRIVVDVNR